MGMGMGIEGTYLSRLSARRERVLETWCGESLIWARMVVELRFLR
jgi:hypothetical protein